MIFSSWISPYLSDSISENPSSVFVTNLDQYVLPISIHYLHQQLLYWAPIQSLFLDLVVFILTMGLTTSKENKFWVCREHSFKGEKYFYLSKYFEVANVTQKQQQQQIESSSFLRILNKFG